MADYNTSANVVVSINGKQAKQMLADLQKQADDLNIKIKNARDIGDSKSLKKFKAELKDVERTMDQIKNSGQKVDAVLQRLDKATPKQLNKAISALTRLIFSTCLFRGLE